MVWNVEQSGAQRSFRIMQKRGVVIDSDDFNDIRATYPEHALSKITPNTRTMEELRQKRHTSNRQKIDTFNSTFEQKREKYQQPHEKAYIYSEFSKTDKPRFTSIKQRFEQDRQNARKNVGLTDTIQDQKDEVNAPSLACIENPKIASKSVL